MPTRADIEAATPRCRADWPDAFQRSTTRNYGRAGGPLTRASLVVRRCLRPMRYRGHDNTWHCECGANVNGHQLGAPR